MYIYISLSLSLALSLSVFFLPLSPSLSVSRTSIYRDPVGWGMLKRESTKRWHPGRGGIGLWSPWKWICRVSQTVDWCCFYYFLRNSLVALLEALFARIFLDLRYRCAEIYIYFFFRPVSYKPPSSASPDQAPVPGCRHSSCVLIIHVCLCVRASMCACENV